MSQGRLHAKTAGIDDSTVHIGSMNLDPRSDTTNSGLGVVRRATKPGTSANHRAREEFVGTISIEWLP